MKIFKHTLFISLVVSSLIIISTFKFDVFTILLVLAGGLLASFFPYLDFVINAFLINPQSESSTEIKSLFLRREYKKLINLVDSNSFSENKPTINSAHFQVILLMLGFYFITTRPVLFGFSFLLSLIFNLIYRLYISMPFYHQWFWIFKNPVSLSFVKMWLYINIAFAVIYIVLI
ncbi:MAG: hypothetical protein O2871_02610 [bacterium]|jgi:hypothetical protein|nr:hypothetical protein [bacterium]